VEDEEDDDDDDDADDDENCTCSAMKPQDIFHVVIAHIPSYEELHRLYHGDKRSIIVGTTSHEELLKQYVQLISGGIGKDGIVVFHLGDTPLASEYGDDEDDDRDELFYVMEALKTVEIESLHIYEEVGKQI